MGKTILTFFVVLGAFVAVALVAYDYGTMQARVVEVQAIHEN